MTISDSVSLGAHVRPEGVQFRVWAPEAERVDLVLASDGDLQPMEQEDGGTFARLVPDLAPGVRYQFRLNEDEAFPDPASRFQPDGIHEASEVIDPAAYAWQDAGWQGVPQEDLVFYELHVGTFTPEGTFAAAQEKLSYLKELGVTAVELMPVADFPGHWGWGYDHAALFAPSRAYGRPDDLRAFVDAAHATGLAVFLDVIYNHLGPDGAYAAAFAPMFTDKHETPWGQAINLDDMHSEGVRRFFIQNALQWLSEYHVDGLRLDATDQLKDDSEPHFLKELTAAVREQLGDGPPRVLVAEDHRNLNTLVLPSDEGGYGLDAVWVDDTHHLIRHITAGDSENYFADFAGTTTKDLAEALRQGWYFTGQYAQAFDGPRGTDPAGVRPEQCVICIQNHDQVGNRPQGARLNHEIPGALYRAASAILLFAPELPLLFMGQEWAASTPFQFFTDHNEELGRLVSEGRKKEFEGFAGFSGDDVPDPQDPATFERSKLDWGEREEGDHGRTLALYRDLLALRRELDGDFAACAVGARGLALQRGRHHLVAALADDLALPLPEGAEVVLHTEDEAFAADAQAPRIEDGEVHFARPGAVVVRA